MSRLLGCALLALLSLSAACNDRDASTAPVERSVRPQLDLAASASFSGWIVQPTVFNEEPESSLDCGPILLTVAGSSCVEVTTQSSGFAGGLYGYDADGDNVFDAILSFDVELRSEIRDPGDGSYQYAWSFINKGSGALTAVDCGPNAPLFAVSATEPLLGSAGEDRLVGTGDDIVEATVYSKSTTSIIGRGLVLCKLASNPETERAAELLVPLEASPTSKEQCKNNGWHDFGFQNQGACVSYVETGNDSRG